MIKVGIIGATGYAGQELVRLLVQHPDVEIKVVASQSNAGKSFADVYPGFKNIFELPCSTENLNTIADEVDLVFLTLPHGEAAKRIDEELIKKTKIIDIGSDFRLKVSKSYETWYAMTHPRPDLLATAVYGLCETHRSEIARARLVGNPGCYATCSILAMSPLLKHGIIDPHSLIIDAKSGVSGAGRTLGLGVHFNECNETIKAYKVAAHRHTPEIEQELSQASTQEIKLSFTPHLVPMNRGILVTAYAQLKAVSQGESPEKIEQQIHAIYKKAYGNEPFIRLYEPGAGEPGENELPETRWVKGSNFCDIGYKVDIRTNRVVVVAALDNLIKGAAGQAIQNMNIMFGLDETRGLRQVPLFPA